MILYVEMKKKILTLIIIGVISGFTVIYLFYISDRINRTPNHFIRLFVPHIQRYLKSYAVNNKSWHIAGVVDDKIMFGNRKYLNVLLNIDLRRNDTSIRILKLPQLSLKSPKIIIKDQNFYILDGEQPAIYKSPISIPNSVHLISEKVYFDTAIPINDETFIIRYVNKKNELSLGKIVNKKLIKSQVVFRLKIDGLMSKDGMLLYDEVTKKIVYVSYYTNRYSVSDSNLNLKLEAKTRDTVNYPKIKVGKPDKHGKITMVAPPKVTNKTCAIYNNYLFIQSALLADNEKKEFFNESSVIDVYDIRKGLYKLSFYIPDYDNKKIKEFKVFGDKLIAMFEDQCVIYKLNQKYFK